MKLRMVLFTLPMLIAIVYAHVFLYRRWVKPLQRTWARRAVVTFSVLAALAGFLARFAGGIGDGSAKRGVIVVALVWSGFLLYVLMFTVALAWLERWSSKRRGRPLIDPARRQLIALGVGAASAGLSGLGIYRSFTAPEISETIVPLKGLPKALEGFTIAQLSDVHVGALIQREFLRELVTRTNAVKADVTVITGDLVDGTVAHLGRYVRELQTLQAKRGVFFITGNHDYYSGADAWANALQGLGIEVLRNRSLALEPGLTLLGVDDWSAARFGEGGYDLDKALQGVDTDKGTVLLAHQPSGFDEVVARGVGLQLSGHTHGGQFFPVTLAASALWQARARGLSREGDSHIFVSKGCGFVGPPFRAGSPPEIAKIVLVSA